MRRGSRVDERSNRETRSERAEKEGRSQGDGVGADHLDADDHERTGDEHAADAFGREVSAVLSEQVTTRQDAAAEFGERECGETEQQGGEQVGAVVKHARQPQGPCDEHTGEDEGEEGGADVGGLTQHRGAALAQRAASGGRSGNLLLERLEEARPEDVDERPDDGEAAVGLIAHGTPGENQEPVRADAVDREPERDGGGAIGQWAALTHALKERADGGAPGRRTARNQGRQSVSAEVALVAVLVVTRRGGLACTDPPNRPRRYGRGSPR